VVAHYGKDRLQLVFINWIQPWHPQATWLHAAALAASLSNDPSHFWKLTDLLYENQDNCACDQPITVPFARTYSHETPRWTVRDEKVEKMSKVDFYDLMATLAKVQWLECPRGSANLFQIG